MDTPRGTVSTGVGVELPCCCRGPGVGVGFWGGRCRASCFFSRLVIRIPRPAVHREGTLHPGLPCFPFPWSGFPFLWRWFPFLWPGFPFPQRVLPPLYGT